MASDTSQVGALETPPRTWRRPNFPLQLRARRRNTSTDVEKTFSEVPRIASQEKHLHGRGEDGRHMSEQTLAKETPPRTWRRPGSVRWPCAGLGNTSTDVEKTGVSVMPEVIIPKHLHGRGEDSRTSGSASRGPETPPRTWRRPPLDNSQRVVEGNTSTDVEKTEGDHDQANNQLETPPRTWRRRKRGRNRHNRAGNTSTDVEKTSFLACPSPCGQKHLHGRGEDGKHMSEQTLAKETPPRTWRRPPQQTEHLKRCRNTSTDVEKTLRPKPQPRCLQKHLHGRGEDLNARKKPLRGRETPPRTWRRP